MEKRPPPGDTPGASETAEVIVRPAGSSLSSFCGTFAATCVVSRTAGADAVTVIASATLATLRSASARPVCDRPTVADFLTGFIPSSANSTEYVPGGMLAKLYAPVSPVVVLRVPCICGDEIVTVTPGSGLPSLVAVPFRLDVICANAGAAAMSRKAGTESTVLLAIDSSFNCLRLDAESLPIVMHVRHRMGDE